MQRGYRTIQTVSEVEIIINKSRFIGRCFPLTQEAQALEKLEELKKRYWDASHNCYAYSLGATGATARFSDDGEPGGTAGMPMMEALKNKKVTDLLCVVTRYFGGVLLGTGGLVRAYSRTACEAIDAAGIVEMRPCIRYRMETEYPRWGRLEGVLRAYGQLQDTEFSDKVAATALVEQNNAGAFLKAVAQNTDGRVVPKAGESLYWPFPVSGGVPDEKRS